MRVNYSCRHHQGNSKAEVEAALLEVPPRSLNLGNIRYGCNTCMPSKIWKKKSLDEAQPRQRWYCRMCDVTYKTKCGTIIELRLYSDIYVAKASIPFNSFKDLQAAVIEAKAAAERTQFDSSQQLFDSLPVLRPMTAANGSPSLRPAVAAEHFEGTNWSTYATQDDLQDCFRFSSKDYDALPELAWETILAIFAQASKTDQFLEAMQDLAELDGMQA